MKTADGNKDVKGSEMNANKWVMLLIGILAAISLAISCSSGGDDDDDSGDDDDDSASGQITINEIVASFFGGPDWIELFNGSGEDLDISNWSLWDDQDRDPFIIPAGTIIKAGEYLVVEHDKTGETGFLFGLGAEDAVRLFDDGEGLSDSTQWLDGQAPEGKSWGRIPDGEGDFRTLQTPSPGEPNADDCGNGSIDGNEQCDGTQLGDATCIGLGFASGDLGCLTDCDFDKSGCVPIQTDVVINELVVNLTNPIGEALPDWIELYNPGGQTDLSGWILKDEKDSNYYVFPSGISIDADGFLVLYSDDTGAQGFNFGFGGQDQARLFDRSETLVDETEWNTDQVPENNSWGRLPDGTGNFQVLTEPSPGELNSAQ